MENWKLKGNTYIEEKQDKIENVICLDVNNL